MKRTPVFFALAIFVFAMTLGLASAVTITGIPSQLSQEGSSFDITITSTANETVSLSIADIFDVDNTYKIDFANVADVVLDNSNNRTADVTIYYTVQSGFIFEFGASYSTTITANGTETGTSYEILNFEETGFCSGIENDARILLNIEDIKIVSGFGDEDDYWYLMDEIEVEVEIEPANYDIEDVEIEWELYNTNGKKIDSDDVSVSDLEENEDEIITFTLKLDSKIEDFDGENAILYIRATGYVDDSDSIYDEEKSCAWTKKEVSVNTKEDFVIVDELKINGNSVRFDDYNIISCGQEIILTGEAWNIGNKDQDDVVVDFYSHLLGVDEVVTFNTIDAYDSEPFSHNFAFPENMDAGIYSLDIEVYDEDNDVYENKEDDESRFTILFKLEESCKFVEPTINANLVGEAYSGKEIVVNAYIRNNNDKEASFVIGAEGYDSWATLSDIEPRMLTLQSGEATEVALTFVAKKDSIGEYNFDINVLVDGKETILQPASINIEKSGFDVRDYLTKSNLQIAGIVLLNLILLIAIIVVAKKIVKKK